ncbi:MAG: nucleotidyltransferase domain-containing protein [Nitrospiraceae bacterium]|jgi:predicted nucleotidyltransferase|nr:nucleotidyltransferase domain-containing protein [Nitrospiraceae bacterium]
MVQPELLETVRQRLVATYEPLAVYVFGSHAWGSPDKGSDLDLLIVVASSDEKPYKRALLGIKALSGLGIAKDILVYTSEEFEELAGHVSTLCYKVKHEGIKLYEAA